MFVGRFAPLSQRKALIFSSPLGLTRDILVHLATRRVDDNERVAGDLEQMVYNLGCESYSKALKALPPPRRSLPKANFGKSALPSLELGTSAGFWFTTGRLFLP
jgi:hypothetical protein